jgi:hypothetical protein
MSLAFRTASKSQARLRMALTGPSGSGKTYTALGIAQAFGRVAVIDTERGSASLYADRFAFDVLELDSYSPKVYVEAIAAAEEVGYDCLVIDSLSHAWNGKDGALEQVDRKAAQSKSGNSFGAWRDVTPLQNALVDAIVGCRMHVIATMRAKTEYVLEDDGRGRKAPRKVGLAPVQRDGIEFEFTVVGELDHAHRLHITKTRWSELSQHVEESAGAQLGERIRRWLADGTPPPAAPKVTPLDQPAAVKQVINLLGGELQLSTAEVVQMMREADSLAELEQVTPHARHLDDDGKRAARSAYSARKKELQA